MFGVLKKRKSRSISISPCNILHRYFKAGVAYVKPHFQNSPRMGFSRFSLIPRNTGIRCPHMRNQSLRSILVLLCKFQIAQNIFLRGKLVTLGQMNVFPIIQRAITLVQNSSLKISTPVFSVVGKFRPQEIHSTNHQAFTHCGTVT